jgi:hypothetical protein
MEKVKKGLLAGASLAALAFGGSAIADAASSSSTTTTTTPSSPQGYGTTGPRGGLGPNGRHVGANGKDCPVARRPGARGGSLPRASY